MGRVWIVAPAGSTTAAATVAKLRAHFGDEFVATSSLDQDGQTAALAEGDVTLLFIERPLAEQPHSKASHSSQQGWSGLQHPLVLAAIESGSPLLPVLVDGVTMPAADELPAQIREVAFKHATPVRSDVRLPRDVGRLVSDLESQLQHVVGRSFGFEFITGPIGLGLAIWGAFFSGIRVREVYGWSYGYESVEQLDNALQTLFWASSVPLGAGMLLLAVSWWWRQWRNYLANRAAHFRSGQGRLPAAPNKFVGGCLCAGGAASGWGVVPGVLAWVLGLLALNSLRRNPAGYRQKRLILGSLALGLFGITNSMIGLPATGQLRAALEAYQAGRAILPAKEEDFQQAQPLEEKEREPPTAAMLDQAEAAYELAIQKRPTYPNAYFRLAEIQATRGNHALALETLNEVIDRYPKGDRGIFSPSQDIVAEVYEFRGKLNQQLGDEQQAAEDLDIADILTPFFDFGGLLRFW